MPRKSPRSRKKIANSTRLPGSGRPRATPGTRTKAARKTAKPARPGHSRTGTARAGAKKKASAAPPSQRAVRPGARPALRAARPGPRGQRVLRLRQGYAPPHPDRVAAILSILAHTYPDATTALDFGTPLQLLIATILSAQCTDVRVNMVTPALFERYPDAAALAAADTPELEAMIRSTGFFRNKARSIRECSADIVAKHGGVVPNTLEELTALRGVGRKTANVVLGNAYGIPGLVVDTHVTRVSRRLGLTDQVDPVKIEFALMQIVPREQWTPFSHWLILHGRAICVARKPRCSICPLAPHCPRIDVTVFE